MDLSLRTNKIFPMRKPAKSPTDSEKGYPSKPSPCTSKAQKLLQTCKNSIIALLVLRGLFTILRILSYLSAGLLYFIQLVLTDRQRAMVVEIKNQLIHILAIVIYEYKQVCLLNSQYQRRFTGTDRRRKTQHETA
jgi:hypothetical protein